MRLRKIKIKNIASLRGEHVVDFAEIAGHSALFAITGETGSGKSTILNSIGLALYGRYFKKSINHDDVVTLGEKEGSVELIFELKGKTFLSIWKIKVRKNNGEELAKIKADRFFFVLSGEDFDSPRENAPQPLEDVLTLDFEQFTKCVVLNQGEFAKFLMSTFSDRRSILEKLCPGQVFDSLTAELNRELKVYNDSQRDLTNSLKTLEEEGPSQANLEENLKSAERDFLLTEKWYELLEKLDGKFATLFTYFQQNSDYIGRIKQTESDIAAQTTVYNELLKKSGDLQKIKEERESELSKREPRLLELLKVEENLSRDNKILENLKALEGKTQKELETSHLQIVKLEKDHSALSAKKTELTARLEYPFESLLSHRQDLEESFALQNILDLLAKDISADQEKLSEATKKGTELSNELKRLTARLEEIPGDLELKLKSLEEKKAAGEKAKARAHELGLRQQKTVKLLSDDKAKSISLESEMKLIEEKRDPLLAQLKIKELLSAVAVCILHPETSAKGSCPVCETPFVSGKLEELRGLVEKSDPRKIQDEETKLRDELTRLRAEREHLLSTIAKNETSLEEDKKELNGLVLYENDELKKVIEANRKLLWERDDLLPKKQKQDLEIEKARIHFGKIRDDLRSRESNAGKKKDELARLIAKLPPDLPFSPASIPRLKSDLSIAYSLGDLLSQMKEITTRLELLKNRTSELSQNLSQHQLDLKNTSESLEKGRSLIKAELQDESVASVHNRLKVSSENARKEFESKEGERRKQENVLRDFQGKLLTYKEQVKEIEVLYANAHESIRNLMAEALPEYSSELTSLKETLKNLDLSLTSPGSLFIPLKDRILSSKAELKLKTNEARSIVVRLKTQKDEQEKRRDRIRLLEMKLADVNHEIQRWERLSKILGKDELRTYVLSLVEENLIIVTNEELSRLCQGRYEIIHQNKGIGNAPEFFILDKFRDGGIRKISTLSGGETFMVSLAMALGLAEMTRGQAEIDTLFIDEGFGTLDQDSLEDVLDVLNQIQTRGLMIGIISHVKSLTDVIPVNLVLSKKRDGTSSVSIRVH